MSEDLTIRWYLVIKAHKHVAIATMIGFLGGLAMSEVGPRIWHLMFS